jgi:4-hydroxysphinganine ceramide fatty acyl 2-hydroxylase
LPQIHNANFTFDEYVTYINEPKHFVNPVRDLILFDNWFLEQVSQTQWYMVPISNIPMVLYCFYNMYYYNFSYNFFAIFAMMIAGLLLWSFTEYAFHRFCFHGEDNWMKYVPHSKYLFTAHFTLHGIHHAFP